MTCGIDIGSASIEVVLLDEGGVRAAVATASGANPSERARRLLAEALVMAGAAHEDIETTVATGFGRNYFAGADRVVSEIQCHAAGVTRLVPAARTVIEIGGQDSKMIRLAPGGRVLDFVMNDRCAAGTGRFIEGVARALAMSLEEVGAAAISADGVSDISAMCAVFAESEIVGMVHRGETPGSVLRGAFRSVARRTIGMAARIGLEDAVVFTGGVARNAGVAAALRELTGRAVVVPPDPHLTGALGAAIIAARVGAETHGHQETRQR